MKLIRFKAGINGLFELKFKGGIYEIDINVIYNPKDKVTHEIVIDGVLSVDEYEELLDILNNNFITINWGDY